MNLENNSPYYKNIKLKTFLNKFQNGDFFKIKVYSLVDCKFLGSFNLIDLLDNENFLKDTFVDNFIIHEDNVEIMVYRWNEEEMCIY